MKVVESEQLESQNKIKTYCFPIFERPMAVKRNESFSAEK